MKFFDLQELLKEKLGIEHLADIARELDVSPQAVSNWKARDRVPYKYVTKIRKQFQNTDHLSKENFDNNEISTKEAFDNYHEYSVSIIDMLYVIIKNFKIIVIIPFIFCVFTIIHVQFIVTPIYNSTAKIMSSSGNSVNSQAAGIAAQFGLNLFSDQNQKEWVYPEIIKSRTLARNMLKRKFDTKKFGAQKSLLQILTYGDQPKPTKEIERLIQSGVNKFIKMIIIQQNGSFYDLTIRATESLFARDLVQTLIEELDSYQRNYNRAKTSEAKKFIEERIIDTENELKIAEEALKVFRDRNRRIENSPSLLLEQQRLLREVSVLTGVFTTLKQQLETTKIEEVKDSDYVVVLDPPEAPLSRSEPKKKESVILSGFLGLGLGVLLSFLIEYFKNSNNQDQEKISKIKLFIVSLLPNIFLKKK